MVPHFKSLYMKLINLLLQTFSIIIINLIITTYCYSQENLVPNPGFEDVNPTVLGGIVGFSYFKNGDWFGYEVKNWNSSINGVWIRSTNTKNFPSEARIGENSKLKFNSIEGKNCVNIFSYNRFDNRGHSEYISSKPTKTLYFGKVYKISAWFYFPKINANDSLAHKHIGFTFLRNPINMERAAESNKNWRFTLSEFRWDEWYEAIWYLRPLCDLNYLMIGTSHTDTWPAINRETNSYYYVDKISITEVTSDTIPKNAIVTPFCKSPEWEDIESHSVIEPTVIHFETNKYELNQEDYPTLDAIATILRANKNLVIEINGYTDEVNADNQALSRKRAESVLNYFTKEKGILQHKFISKGLANSKPLCNTKDEACRSKNRRVELISSKIDASQVIYQKMLDKIKTKDIDSAFQLVKLWLYFIQPYNKIVLLLDPRVKALVTNKRYQKPIIKMIKDDYNRHKYSEERYFLDSLFWEDQRHDILEREYYYFNAAKAPDSLFENIDYAEDNRRNQKLCLVLDEFIKKHGWPDDSKYGAFSGAVPFNILTHNNDSTTLRKNLSLLKEKCLIGESSWHNYAKLYDRLMKLQDKPQIYGTIMVDFALDPDYMVLYRCVPLDELNKNREKIGLVPFSNERYYENQPKQLYYRQ